MLFTSSVMAQVSRNFNKAKKPKYEIGGGFAYFNIPNYPGSRGSELRFIPFPIVIYRGDIFRIDEDGTRARIIKKKVYEFGFSGGLNFAIKEKDNEIRRGMGDTGALVGLGPALIFNLLKTDSKKVIAGLGLRSNFEFNSTSDINYRGLTVDPYIRFLYKPSVKSQFTFLSSWNIIFGEKKYNDFFYGVAPDKVTANRAAYEAKAGIVESTTFLGFTYDTRYKLSLFAGGYYSNLSIAANKRSNLLEKEHNFGVGAGLTWLFHQSKELVE